MKGNIQPSLLHFSAIAAGRVPAAFCYDPPQGQGHKAGKGPRTYGGGDARIFGSVDADGYGTGCHRHGRGHGDRHRTGCDRQDNSDSVSRHHQSDIWFDDELGLLHVNTWPEVEGFHVYGVLGYLQVKHLLDFY